VDLLVEVSHVQDQRSLLLEQMRMTTLSGREVDYAFHLALPAEVLGMAPGEGLQEVGVTVRIMPRYQEDGDLDVHVTLLDPVGRPWTEGTPLHRTARRSVAPGEGITLDLTSLGGALTYRFSVVPYY
jgi:hypothetical protein